jgi:predicted Zn finger-like uncharacterized protein
MIVTCEGCETSFQVEDHRIKSTGSKVRCSKCRHVFLAYPPPAIEPEEPLILEKEVPAAVVAENQTGLSETDFQLEALLGQDAAEKADVASIVAEPEFLKDAALDFDLGVEPVLPSSIEESLAALDALDIKLGDLGQFDEAFEPAAAQTPDFRLGLGLEAPASERTDAGFDAGVDADLSAVFESVDTAGTEEAAPPAGSVDEAELELDLSLNETIPQQRQEARPSAAGEDELDLSDLECMLEGVEKDLALKPAATDGIDLELDLGAVIADETKSDAVQELDLTDFAEPAEKDTASARAATEELDFSGLADILDEKAFALEKKEGVEEVTLVFDDLPTAKRVETEPTAVSPPGDSLKLDLDKLLEDDEEKTPVIPEIEAHTAHDFHADFGNEMVRQPDGELEIEIEPLVGSDDFEGGQPAAGTAAAVASVAAAGAAIAASTATGPEKTPAGKRGPSLDEFTPTGRTGATDVPGAGAARPAVSAEQKAKAPERPGRIGKLLLSAAVLGVLVVAALVIPRGLGVHIPFLRDVDIPLFGKIFETEPEDLMGNLKIMTVPESVSAEFIENAGVGRLCVIKGQVRNNYDHPRSFIRITGKLYDPKKNVVKMVTVFAGNVLSKEELAGQSFGAISALLKNKTGANNLNVGVKPGAAIPFMVVFDGLPESLDEYSVEVAGSSS